MFLHVFSKAGNKCQIFLRSVAKSWGWIGVFRSRNEQVVAWNLLWTPTASLEAWTAGTGASVHQHRAHFWPVGSLGCTTVKTLVGVLALSCGSWGGWCSGLTHVSCPYSVDKLPQLWLLFKAVPLLSPIPCRTQDRCRWSPSDLKVHWGNEWDELIALSGQPKDYMMGSHKVSACLLKPRL